MVMPFHSPKQNKMGFAGNPSHDQSESVSTCMQYASWLVMDVPAAIVYNDDVERLLESGAFSMEEIFGWVCKAGRLDDVQWLHCFTFGKDPYYRQLGFQRACAHGQLHVAQWLVAQGGVEIHEEHDMAFRSAAQNHHSDLCTWLKSLDQTAVWPCL